MAWGPAALWAAVLFLLSETEPVSSGLWTLVNDKVAHLALYLVLGVALAWGRHRARKKIPLGLLILAGMAYGASDEWHQSFVPGRTPSLGDFLADSLGVAIGVGVAAALLARGAKETDLTV
jgi:VanZ family protein